jgi:hypothetical protein
MIDFQAFWYAISPSRKTAARLAAVEDCLSALEETFRDHARDAYLLRLDQECAERDISATEARISQLEAPKPPLLKRLTDALSLFDPRARSMEP